MPPTIRFDVPGLSQPNSSICWWAAMKMLILYHRNRGVLNTVLNDIESNQYAMHKYDINEGATANEIEVIAQAIGFSILPCTLNGQGLYSHMQRHGPQVYSGYWADDEGGHAVVLAGTDGNRISIRDPLFGGGAANYFRFSSQYLIMHTALIYLNDGNL